MEKYVCIKQVSATPTFLNDYYKGTGIEASLDYQGYLVLPNKDEMAEPAWISKEDFEKTHFPITKLPFAAAFSMLVSGHRIRRSSWGEGIWLSIEQHKCVSDNTGEVKLTPWIGVRLPDNTFTPWHCPCVDALENDWEVITD